MRYANRGWSKSSAPSPADAAKRIRRAASALQQGVEAKELMQERGFTKLEIRQAQEMLALGTSVRGLARAQK